MAVHIFTAVFLQPRCSAWLTWHSEGTSPSCSENLQYLVSSVLCMLIIFSWKRLKWRAILKLERKTSVLSWKSELDMEKPKSPSTDECLKKTRHTHTMESYSALIKKEVLPFVAIQMKLEIIINEIRQTQKDRHCFHLYVCESYSVMSDSLRPHGLYSPWVFPGQNYWCE